MRVYLPVTKGLHRYGCNKAGDRYLYHAANQKQPPVHWAFLLKAQDGMYIYIFMVFSGSSWHSTKGNAGATSIS